MCLQVHMIYESPIHCGECTKHEGSYDLTATYTQDSDFTSIYWTNSGLYWSDEARSDSPKTDVHRSKTRFAAALVSNCRADRLSYLRHLQTFMSQIAHKRSRDICYFNEFIFKEYKKCAPAQI